MSIGDEYVQPALPGMEPPPTVELDVNGYELALRLKKARDAIKQWKRIETEASEALKKILTGSGGHEGKFVGLRSGYAVVTANCHTTRRFDSTAFRADHPEMYEQYLRESLVTVVKPEGE